MSEEQTPKDDLNRAAAGTIDERMKAARFNIIKKLVESVPGMTVEKGLSLLDEDVWLKPSMGSIIGRAPEF